jgi:hypothetical protein
MITMFKKNLYRFVVAMFSVLTIVSCQKDIDDTIVNPPTDEIPDLSSKVSSSVSGFVTDENNAAVLGASVKVGTATATTDKYGYFEIKNVDVVKNAATVTVTKAGYFKGIKTYIATANKAAFFRIKLMPNTTAGTIDAAAGGNVTLANGLIVALPANAVVNATTGAAYTGTINVAAQWLNPTAPDLNSIMPGDLRALNAGGALRLLKTFGMAAVELTGAGGELLQIATGKKATLTFPLPSAISGAAPASIQLWYFDENVGLWKEEGSATKTGNTYVGEVSHFSFWNCDVPNDYVQFSCTIVDENGDPIPFILTKISVVSDPSNAAFGYTDSTGFVSGAVPDNSSLKLEVYTSYSCLNTIYSQNFTTSNSNVNLGNITVPASSSSIGNVTGTATDCSSLPLTNGYIIMQKDNYYTRYAVSNTGTFDFNAVLCSGSAVVTLIAEDVAAAQQSNPATYTINTGANAIGNLQACGVTTQEFVNYTIDGVPSSYTAPGDSVYMSGNGTNTSFLIGGFNTSNQDNFLISIDRNNIALNSVQPLINFTYNQNSLVPATSVGVTITEYGAIGQFIAGNFTGVCSTQSTPVANLNVTCSFRVRRTF